MTKYLDQTTHCHWQLLNLIANERFGWSPDLDTNIKVNLGVLK